MGLTSQAASVLMNFLVNEHFYDIVGAFYMRVATCPPNLVWVGRSFSKEMATVFRNSRWRSRNHESWRLWYFWNDKCSSRRIRNILFFLATVIFFDITCSCFTVIVKKVVEVNRNPRCRRQPSWKRNTSGCTTSMSKQFPVFNLQSNFCGVILTFESSLLSRVSMLKRFPLQIGQVQKRVGILVCFGPETP